MKLYRLAFFQLLLLTRLLGGQNACSRVETGVDFLYWKPCLNDSRYAVVSDVSSDEFPVLLLNAKYARIDPDWDEGIRARIAIDKAWMGFNVECIFTSFETEHKTSISSSISNSITFSSGHPREFISGNLASAQWSCDYKAVDAIALYPIELNRCNQFVLAPYSGLRWIELDQKRTDSITDEAIQSGGIYTNQRTANYWGIGPVIGIKTDYTFCDTFNIFGNISAYLLVGEAEWKNTFTHDFLDGDNNYTLNYNTDENCFCMPGLQFQAGVSYTANVCQRPVKLYIGYEYLQWINAPAFFDFQTNFDNNLAFFGALASKPEANITFQGYFAGISIEF